MRGGDLQERTRAFALRVIREVECLPRGRTSDVIGKQLLRSGTSVGANHRAACRARSEADFIAKLKIVEEEADESVYRLELLHESGLTPEGRVAELIAEGNALVAITVVSIKTMRDHAPATRGVAGNGV